MRNIDFKFGDRCPLSFDLRQAGALIGHSL